MRGEKIYEETAPVVDSYGVIMRDKVWAEVHFPKPDNYTGARYYSVKIEVEKGSLQYDLDNVVKHVLDALKLAGLISDDRYVLNIEATKREGYIESTKVEIYEWIPEP